MHLGTATSGNAPAKNTTDPNTGAAPTFYIPAENEWYKAAYYSPVKGGPSTPGYFLYGTGYDATPARGAGSERACSPLCFQGQPHSARTTLRTRPPLPPSNRGYTPAQSADRHRPEAHCRNPSILSPAVTATGTTFWAAWIKGTSSKDASLQHDLISAPVQLVSSGRGCFPVGMERSGSRRALFGGQGLSDAEPREGEANGGHRGAAPVGGGAFLLRDGLLRFTLAAARRYVLAGVGGGGACGGHEMVPDVVCGVVWDRG
jgi:hypothetical protein